MELFDSETKNRDYLFKFLKDNGEIAKQNCHIGTEIPVPYKHIYFPIRNSLEIWCFKQDICIYQKLFDKNIGRKGITINSSGKRVLNVTIENESKDNDVGMPFVIIETKLAKTKTEDILATSEKIKMIKSIFPYWKAYLLIFGLPHSRIYRLCSGFDEILFMTDFNEKRIDDINKKINNGFNLSYGNVPFVFSYNYPYGPE